MSAFKSLSQCLLVGMLRVGLGFAQCDSIFYTNDGDLCYGMREDKSTDECVDIPDVGSVEAFVRNPITEEFYIVAYNGTDRPYAEDFTEHPRYLYKFTATLESGVPVIDTPVQIAEYTASAELLNALAFTCQGVPRLFALSSDLSSPQYLYEVDYENDGSLTELYSWTFDGFEFITGYGLFYNNERERLYRIAGFPTSAFEINPDNITDSRNVTSFLWDADNNWYNGFTVFASYYNEDFFITSNGVAGVVFTAQLGNATYVDALAFDSRLGSDATAPDYIHGIECSDAITRCFDTFTNEPSLEPSGQPSQTPTTDPSMMPSTDPSMMPTYEPTTPTVVPTQMPVEPEMMTTEDEVMADTTMEPESPEATTDDSPEPTVADSASKNSISFIMVFTAAFGYLFY